MLFLLNRKKQKKLNVIVNVIVIVNVTVNVIIYIICGGGRHDEYACARTYPQLQKLSTYPQKSVGKIAHFPQNNPCIYIAVDI